MLLPYLPVLKVRYEVSVILYLEVFVYLFLEQVWNRIQVRSRRNGFEILYMAGFHE